MNAEGEKQCCAKQAKIWWNKMEKSKEKKIDFVFGGENASYPDIGDIKQGFVFNNPPPPPRICDASSQI